MTGYILVEIGFEYNDEYYTKNDGGKPLKCYLNKERADKECKKLNKKRLEKNPLHSGDFSDSDEDEYHTEYYRVEQVEIDDVPF